MIEITVKVSGDHWGNVYEVAEQLRHARPGEHIVLDIGSEGASLRALGIEDLLLKHCAETKTPHDLVTISNWPNTLEQTPFSRGYIPRISHFVWMSKNYWLDTVPPGQHEYKFGYFMGRRTPSRLAMMYQVNQLHPGEFLLSAMKTQVPDPWVSVPNGMYLEKISDWIGQDEIDWWQTAPVGSVDDHWVNEQYQTNKNTNRDLLSVYPKFDIELVAETYTLGETFFPTEKTIRPVMASRPVIVYGPVNYLANFKKLGFQTYSSLWDESYDQFQGPQRWTAIKAVIQQLIELPRSQFIFLIESAQSIAQANRQHLTTLIERYQPK
jgi:hypothetical protein